MILVSQVETELNTVTVQKENMKMKMENAKNALTNAKLAKTKTPVSFVLETELLINVSALPDIGMT